MPVLTKHLIVRLTVLCAIQEDKTVTIGEFKNVQVQTQNITELFVSLKLLLFLSFLKTCDNVQMIQK